MPFLMDSVNRLTVRDPPFAAEDVAQMHAFTNPGIFGDERDNILMSLFRLEAAWGCGQGFYGAGATNTVPFKPEGKFCELKACYYKPIPEPLLSNEESKEKEEKRESLVTLTSFLRQSSIGATTLSNLSSERDGKGVDGGENGHVCMTVKKSAAEVTNASARQRICEGIRKLITSTFPQQASSVAGVHIADFISIDKDTTALVLYVSRPSTTDGTLFPNISTNRVPAEDVVKALSHQTIAQQLKQHLNVINITTQTVNLTPASIAEYLSTPPCGIHPLLWQQAINNNPNPQKWLPVVSLGHQSLHDRLQAQIQTSKVLNKRMKDMETEVNSLVTNGSSLATRVQETHRNLLALAHRLLLVATKLHVSRQNKCHTSARTTTNEDSIIAERISRLVSSLQPPSSLVGKLDELKAAASHDSLLVSHSSNSNSISNEEEQTTTTSTFGKEFVGEIRSFLQRQLTGTRHLIKTINEDYQDLNTLSDDLEQLSTSSRH